jgi:hypothetical protein
MGHVNFGNIVVQFVVVPGKFNIAFFLKEKKLKEEREKKKNCYYEANDIYCYWNKEKKSHCSHLVFVRI